MRQRLTSCTVTLALIATSSFPVAQTTPIPGRAEGETVFPVRVSTCGRYLEDRNGRPFLLHGDTAWYLIVELTREETEEYLENRRQKGFNAILVSLGETNLPDNPTKNKYGDALFTKPEDFSTPNEKFFAHADWVIQKAREKGILVVLNPCYTGTAGGKDALRNAVVANGPMKCRNYGRYIGNRYKNYTNIIWQAVGDMTPTQGSAMEKNWLDILQGIKEFAPGHLWSAHYRRRSTALDQSAFAPHMSIDNAYGGNRSYIHTLRAYNRPNPKPTFYNEGYYEDTHLGTTSDVGKPPMLRAQAYWAILSGATGHIFGSGHVYGFGNPFYIKPELRDWRTGMDRQGSQEMVYVKRLFDGCAWHELVPDQDHSVVTSGYGTFGKDDRTPGGDYVTAARTGDGSLVMAYVPSTGTKPRTITLDMARLSGAANARWYNPTNGTYTSIAESPFPNSGARGFTTPGDNGTGTNDWVLVLETAGVEAKNATSSNTHATAARAANFTIGTGPALKFGVHEIVLTGDGSVANPFDTLATVTFVPPSGEKNARTVWAFYDGENIWRARVYVSEPGRWRWASRCATDAKLNGKSGSFQATKSKLRGRLLPHPKNSRHWMTEDGRWFLNLSDTAYFLLCRQDGNGDRISDEDALHYVRDEVARGITSVRCFLASRRGGFTESSEQWNEWHFEDKILDRFRLDNLQCTDRRLRMLLDSHPDVAVQLILFPLEAYGRDDRFWTALTLTQRERLLRHLVARFGAYPQLLWLMTNDAHYGPKFPNSNAMVREVGAYLQQHDPWQHPRSTGHARRLPFFFGGEDWATYIHIEHAHDLGALEYDKYHELAKPVFLGEDRYEQDHGPRLDPMHMCYWQRRLFWAWLLSGGSANYGGRWWAVHPYGETGTRTATYHKRKDVTFRTPLTGLDSVGHIRDYFEQRAIDLGEFEPDHALASDLDGGAGVRAPKLMRRGQEEFLIYHPHAAADDQEAKTDVEKTAGLKLDLRTATGTFAVEWYRAEDGAVHDGGTIEGGHVTDMLAPWAGHDAVLRLSKPRRHGVTQRREGES